MQGENTLMSSSEKKVVSAKDEGMAVKQMKGRTTHRYINRELSWLALTSGFCQNAVTAVIRFLNVSVFYLYRQIT